MDYRTVVTGIGEMVSEFIRHGMLIVFDDNAPAELAEMALQHTKADMEKDVQAGDVVVLGDSDYVVTAVGSDANRTLRTMGHCTFKFSGKAEAEMPGQIELDGKSLPSVKPGDQFQIMFA